MEISACQLSRSDLRDVSNSLAHFGNLMPPNSLYKPAHARFGFRLHSEAGPATSVRHRRSTNVLTTIGSNRMTLGFFRLNTPYWEFSAYFAHKRKRCATPPGNRKDITFYDSASDLTVAHSKKKIRIQPADLRQSGISPFAGPRAFGREPQCTLSSYPHSC